MTAPTYTQARARADRRWAELNARLRTITPQALGRAALATGTIVITLWVLAASWPAIVPFVVGAVIAYAVLPIANRLDAFMPRVLAALLAEVVALGVLAAAFVLVVPPLLRGIVQVALKLPTGDQIQAGLANLEAQLGSLPDPVRGIVLTVTTEVVARLSSTLDQMAVGAAAFITDQMLGILGTVSFVVGLLVIPAWILTMVADEGSIKRRAMALVAPAFRKDVAAMGRIVDRAFSAFLRGQVLLAISTGLMVWAGLEIAAAAGIAEYPYAVPAATLVGMLQLIPELGFFLGWFPVLLVLVIAGPVPAAAAAVVYVAAVKASGALIGSRVHRGVLDVHPGLLIPGIVVLSQFGVGWLLFGAPIIAVARDTVRYLSGRLSETPTPAGVLPGDRRRASPTAAPAPIPSVYRGATTRERSTVS
jgi:predicted PurR-regulated permease PerM